ncbi:MAG: hypothetical protein KJZ83_07130 [Burkholderiaceae bacterium]|nr:hypothetical protein [Burkholderiaceae bacterium]
MADRYVSTTGADANPGNNWNVAFATVQKGIDDCAATGGGTVHVAHGYYAQRVTGKTGVNLKGYGPVAGAQPLELPSFGEGVDVCPGKPILDGTGGGTVIALANVNNVKVENFNIVRGDADQNNKGGGVYILGREIEVKACCLIANTADADGGGACVDTASATITFDDNLFWMNVADGGGGGLAIVSAKGVRVVNDNSFIDNRNTSGGNVGGGGVHVRESKEIVIDRASFTTNQSSYGGGGLFATDCSGGTPAVLVTNARFSANASDHRGGGAGMMRQSWVTFRACEFRANTAKVDGGAVSVNNLGNAGGHAPAAHRVAKTYVALENCTIAGNEARDDGGGLYVSSSSLGIVTDCSFTQNSCQNNGGAIQCTYASALDVTSSTFEHNLSRQGDGGAISLRNADLQVSGTSSFSHNVARRGRGGAVFTRTADIDAHYTVFLARWGYVARGGTTANISGANFANNFARNGGGGVGALGSHYTLATNLTQCTFENNRVQQAGPGGGVWGEGTALTVTASTFQNNQVFMPGQSARGGAVAAISCPSFTMTGGTVAHNRAFFGGGVAMLGCPNPAVTNVTFNMNFITVPPGAGEEIHSQACAGVTANGLINANQGIVPGRVAVVP